MNKLACKVIDGILPRITGTRGKQRLSILIYHRVLGDYDYMRSSVPTSEQFDWHMQLLSTYFCPLSLTSAISLMEGGDLPERAVCVTFDDGYADNAELALPLLKKWGIPATVFVSSSFLDGGRMWNDTVIEAVRSAPSSTFDLCEIGLEAYSLDSDESRRRCAYAILKKIKHLSPVERQDAVDLVASQSGQLPADLMLTTSQLKLLHSNGIDIGAHTHTHPILLSLDANEAIKEIQLGRQLLERLLDTQVNFFAYPNGIPGTDYTSVHRDIIKEEGFLAAVSTHWGVSSRNTDRWQLPRFTPWDVTPERFLSKLILNQRNLV